MDNTLDILNEILGTLGQVKNLMEANSPQAQGQQPLNVQEAVVNQAASGTGANMTGVGALLESLTKYIKEFDQSKADVALLGFEYFVETINKTIEFDDSTIKNLESVTDAFNIFSDVIKHLLETEQLDDVSIANIIDSIIDALPDFFNISFKYSIFIFLLYRSILPLDYGNCVNFLK